MKFSLRFARIKAFFRKMSMKTEGSYSADCLKEKHKCLNCGNEFNGDFCPVCGQKADVARIGTTRSLWEDLLNGFTNIDNRFFRTALCLVINPGRLILNYLKGKRADYFRPFQMLFILAAVYGMIVYLFFPDLLSNNLVTIDKGSDVEKSLQSMLGPVSISDAVRHFVNKVFEIYNSNIAFNTLLLLPFFTLATKMAFKKHYRDRYDFNMVELGVVRAYVSCQLLIAAIIWLFFGHRPGILIEVILTCWIYLQIFGENKKRTLFHILLMYIYIFLMLIFVVFFLTLLFYLCIRIFK